MTGKFIVMDGVEGCGKSTQIRLLAEAVGRAGRTVTVTHEPGGTPIGERIRALILSPEHPEMTPLTEVMLFCASRAQHCEQVIVPALAEGQVVICDRFASATAVYQGYAGGLGLDVVERVNAEATGGLMPDLLIVLDLAPEIGLRRKFGDQRPSGDRIEEKSLQFHRRVRDGFLEYARLYPHSAVVISADASPDDVHRAILACVSDRLGLELAQGA